MVQFNIPKEVREIISKFKKAGFEIYIVGGAVRDLLMAKPVVDWDFTTNTPPEKTLKILGKEAYYNNIFGMVGLAAKTKGLKPFEITTFRLESGYSDKRRPDKIKWGKTLEEDLKRRDFTINAMALKDQKIFDPHNGQKDLTKKLIRAVGDPHERFSEDALRMMRAVRLAAELKFKIEPKTLEAIKSNSALINQIARERIRDELLKTLASANAYQGMILLRKSGLMQEILPEFEKTFGVEQASPQRHHIYDVGTHSLLSLKHCQNPDPIVRLATLIHDIGKPQTYKKQPNGVITFYNHELVSARMARNIAERLHFSKKQTQLLWRLVRWHQFTVDERQTDKAIRRFIKRVGLENVKEMMDLRRADRLGGGARETSWRTEKFKKRLLEVQKQPFTVRDLKITGHEVMKKLKLKPGPKVGDILDQLFQEVVEKKLENEKKALLKRLKTLA